MSVSGLKRILRAAAVVDLAEVFELALGMAALERHSIELLAAGDLDLQPRGQRVHHRYADAMQAARGLINLGVELAAGMQRAHDHFERGFLRKFRMRIDRNAAAIVGDGQKSVGAQFHLDERGMAGQRLVHRIVDDFGEQMVQRLLVGAADIHARPAPHRLQAFEDFDVARGIAGFGAGGARGDLERRPALSAHRRRTGRSTDLVLVADFNALDMFFHVLRAAWRGESVPLTMPRMGLKSDGTWLGGEGGSRSPSSGHAGEVRNTMTASSAIAATAIKDPTAGGNGTECLFRTTTARTTIVPPAGNRTTAAPA